MHPHLSPENQFVHYVKGDDFTLPRGEGLKIIINIVDNLGTWRADALSKRWSKPEKSYREWRVKFPALFRLGEIQFVLVDQDLVVVNMVAQIKNIFNYEALAKCLSKLSRFEGDFSIHAPIAEISDEGWKKVESLLIKYLICRDISVTIYDTP